MVRVLRSNGVTFVQAGRALLVPLTEVQRKIPPLWDSLLLAERARAEAARGEGAREARLPRGGVGRQRR